MRISQQRRFTLIAIIVVAALGLAAAVGASVPDGSGVIHACYNPASGGLRVIDTAKSGSCLPVEKAVTWNVRGPAGPQGPQGDQGDPGPSYSAGTGLGLSGTTFGIEGSYQLPQGCSTGQSPFLLGTPLSHPWSCFTAANADESCSSGKVQAGVDANGDIICETPPTSSPAGPDVWSDRTTTEPDVPADGLWTTILSLSVPAGTFVIDATGEAGDDDGGNDEVIMTCRAQVGLTQVANLQRFLSFEPENGIVATGEFAMHDVVTFPSATTIDLACMDDAGSDHIDDAEFTALKVGTAH